MIFAWHIIRTWQKGSFLFLKPSTTFFFLSFNVSTLFQRLFPSVVCSSHSRLDSYFASFSLDATTVTVTWQKVSLGPCSAEWAKKSRCQLKEAPATVYQCLTSVEDAAAMPSSFCFFLEGLFQDGRD